MILNRKDFLDAVKFLKPAIGENDSRKNLMVLNVENKSPGWARLTGANAFIAKRVDIPSHDTKKFFKFHISKNALCVFEKICKLDKNIEVVNLSATELKCGDLGLKHKQLEIEYPNLDNLMATEYKDNPEDNYTGLNAWLVGEAMKGFSKDQMDVVKFWFKGKHAPVKITSQDGNYMAMIMPVRIEW